MVTLHFFWQKRHTRTFKDWPKERMTRMDKFLFLDSIAIHCSAHPGSLRKDCDMLDIGAKSHVLALLVWVSREKGYIGIMMDFYALCEGRAIAFLPQTYRFSSKNEKSVILPIAPILY
jgi:hypothetical protein